MGTAARPAPTSSAGRSLAPPRSPGHRPRSQRCSAPAGGRAAISGPVITNEPQAPPGGIATHGSYRCRESGLPKWTSTGRPAGSPASSTARVRPSGVRTVRSMSPPGPFWRFACAQPGYTFPQRQAATPGPASPQAPDPEPAASYCQLASMASLMIRPGSFSQVELGDSNPNPCLQTDVCTRSSRADLASQSSVSSREVPLVTPVNGTLMARRLPSGSTGVLTARRALRRSGPGGSGARRY
jgi:hypothetical protein